MTFLTHAEEHSPERAPRGETVHSASLTAAVHVVRWVSCALAVLLFAYYIHISYHWPVLWDGASMHYVVLLMRHGFHPYTDITDMNLTGCYLTERWAMNIFGWGDLAWRFYEFFLLTVLLGAGLVIGGRRRWMAGVYCALFFMLMHGAEGVRMAVERDEVMTVLVIVATAFYFLALRHGRDWLLLPFGLLCALATSIKPGVLLTTTLLLALALVVRRRQDRPLWPVLTYVVGANLFVLLCMLGFLLEQHALAGFVFIWRTVLPSYIEEKNLGRLYLLRHMTPVPLFVLVLVALAAAFVRRERLGWERMALLLGTGAGALTYWVQGKGYIYHRYTYTAFLLLWIGWELSDSERWPGLRPRLLEIAGLVLLFTVAAPFYVNRMRIFPTIVPQPESIGHAIQRDLTALGGSDLQHQVQCLDLVDGCITALYHLRLIQNTGTTGDLLLFSPHNSFAVTYYRHWFMDRELAHPPDVIVLGNEWYFDYNTKGQKLDTWPAYEHYLEANYVSVAKRTFATGEFAQMKLEHGLIDTLAAPNYQILLRKGSDVLAREQKNPLPYEDCNESLGAGCR